MKKSIEKLNQETADKLKNLPGLTQKTINILDATEIRIFYETFGSFETAEDLNQFIEENYN